MNLPPFVFPDHGEEHSTTLRLVSFKGARSAEARNIDVVAGLIYDGITQLLIRTIKGQTGAGDKLVGLLQLLFKALDGDERRITLTGPEDLQAALTSVTAVLGFRPGSFQPPALPAPDDDASES